MKIILLLALFQTDNVEVIYSNLIYKINCSRSTSQSGNIIYTLYGQDSRFEALTHTINVYSGPDVIGFMNEVTEFVQNGQKDDEEIIRGYRVVIRYKSMSFRISETRGQGWKMVPTKTWIKMQKKIANVVN